MSLVGKLGRWLGAVNFLAALRDDDALATTVLRGAMSTIDFDKLAQIPVGAAPGIKVISPIIDFTAVGNTQVMNPLLGYTGLPISTLFVLTSAAGTQTAPPTVSIGTTGPNYNDLYVAGSTPTNGNHAAAVSSGTPSRSFANLTQSTVSLPNLNAGLFVRVSVGGTGTGGYVCQGRLVQLLSAFPT